MVKEIQLTQGKVALVDDADYEYLSQWKWHAQLIKGRWYARRSIRKGFPKQISLSMHQVILNTPNGMESDHKNGNGLDNQRHNLRVCTKYKNMYNQNIQTRSKSSKFKGVYWSKKYRKWVAQIRVNHKAIWLGQFNSEIEAANTYNMAAKRIFGEFAKLNITEVEKMSEKLCTDCGHPISEHSNVLGCCLICVSCNRTPADLQPKQCPECGGSGVGYYSKEYDKEFPCNSCNGTGLTQPQPQMPLREQLPESVDSYDVCQICEDYDDCRHHNGCCEELLKAQRDADMAWHTLEADRLYKEAFEKGKQIGEATQAARDSAIAAQARREFADKVCEDMPLAPFIGGLNPDNPEAFDLLKKGIALRQNICNWIYRAMAKEG